MLELAAPALVIESYKDRQSFARWVCDVYVDGIDGMAFAEHMATIGHGRLVRV